MKEITMTIPQYNALMRGEITLEEIKQMNGFENIAKRILSDKRLTVLSTFVIANLLYCEKVMAATTNPLDPINTAGNMFLGIIQTVGYWLCLIMCLVEVIKTLMNGQSDKCGKIVVRYLCIFAGLYFMPWCFNIIRDIFKGM